MKRTRVVLFLVLGLLGLAAASQRIEAAEEGQLLIRFSPTLGMDVGLVMGIDGRTAGAITRGHVFKRYLSSGPHQITVKRNGRGFEALHMRLNVRPGQTYSYVAKLPDDQVVLEPSGLPR